MWLATIFVLPSDPSLQERASEVTMEELVSEGMQKTIDGMMEIARGERGDVEKRVMVGLAGPQVGVMKRVILVDVGVLSDRKNLGELRVYVNPEIVWQSEEMELDREGCFSVDSRVCGIVPRAKEIEIEALDRFGNSVKEKLFGFTARIFQHEVDHLEGIRFPDRVGPQGKLHWVEKEDFSEYRKNFENWPYTCPWETWMCMKQGEAWKHS